MRMRVLATKVTQLWPALLPLNPTVESSSDSPTKDFAEKEFYHLTPLLKRLISKKEDHTVIQITEFPIKKFIYYEITTILMVIYGVFHNTFSADHKSLV